MSPTATAHLESWYWGSFHELKTRAYKALSEVEVDTLDSALVHDVLDDAAPPDLAQKLRPCTPPKYFQRDRKQLAAFGAVSFLCGSWMDVEYGRAYQVALERLLRERDDSMDSWVSSPRLALGVSMGIHHFRAHGSIAILGEKIRERLVREIQSDSTDIRDKVLMTRAILLLTSDKASERAQLDPIIRQILAPAEDGFSSREVVAAIWSYHRFGAYCQPLYCDELAERAQRLEDRLPYLQVNSFEPVDWAMLWVGLDRLQASLAAHKPADPLKHIESAIDNFSDMVNKLRHRRKSKANLTVEDEYDVQDILYVALKPSFPDLEFEDPTGKDMGSSKRVDLVSQNRSVIIDSIVKTPGRSGPSRA